MKLVTLHGALADKFGSDPIKVVANSPLMITRYLIGRFGVEFRKMIADGQFHLLKNNERDIGNEEVSMGFSEEELHYIPVVEGSSNVFRIVLGVVLIAASFIPGVGVVTAGYLFSAGVGLTLGGIVGLLTPVPTVSNQTYANKLLSNVFQSQENVTTQGGPVPCVFGRFLCGSVVISAGINTEQIGTANLDPAVTNPFTPGGGGFGNQNHF